MMVLTASPARPLGGFDTVQVTLREARRALAQQWMDGGPILLDHWLYAATDKAVQSEIAAAEFVTPLGDTLLLPDLETVRGLGWLNLALAFEHFGANDTRLLACCVRYETSKLPRLKGLHAPILECELSELLAGDIAWRYDLHSPFQLVYFAQRLASILGTEVLEEAVIFTYPQR